MQILTFRTGCLCSGLSEKEQCKLEGHQCGVGTPPQDKTFCWTHVKSTPSWETAPKSSLTGKELVPSKSAFLNMCTLPSRIKLQYEIPALTSHFSRHQEPQRELKLTKEKFLGHQMCVEFQRLLARSMK